MNRISPNKRCNQCKTKGASYHRGIYSFCDEGCAAVFATGKVQAERKQEQKKREARAKEEMKELKVKAMTKSDYEKPLQAAINAIVREIDKFVPCISSGRPWKPTDQAGHYLSRGAFSSLRYHLFNIYSQSVADNMYKSGNQAGFREGIIKVYGSETMGYVSDLKVMYPELKLTNSELTEVTKAAKEALKLVQQQRENYPHTAFPVELRMSLRKDCNFLIGIYQ